MQRPGERGFLPGVARRLPLVVFQSAGVSRTLVPPAELALGGTDG